MVHVRRFRILLMIVGGLDLARVRAQCVRRRFRGSIRGRSGGCPHGCTKASSRARGPLAIAETIEYEMPGGTISVRCSGPRSSSALTRARRKSASSGDRRRSEIRCAWLLVARRGAEPRRRRAERVALRERRARRPSADPPDRRRAAPADRRSPIATTHSATLAAVDRDASSHLRFGRESSPACVLAQNVCAISQDTQFTGRVVSVRGIARGAEGVEDLVIVRA